MTQEGDTQQGPHTQLHFLCHLIVKGGKNCVLVLRMIQFFMLWGTGNTSPRAQEVRLPSYVCAARCFLPFCSSSFHFF